MESWSSPEVVATCVVGLALLAIFVAVELRTTRPLVDLRLLKGRLFRSTNVVMFLVAAAFLGTLYLVPLYFQDARGLSALQSGLSTFPEAFGVMLGAQFASRLIYPRLGPRRHISGGLIGLALCLLLLTQVTLTTNLWLIRGVMFLLGWMMAQVMVPNQAASFAMISAESMGRASTFFNTMRQVGSATGVAVLSTVLIGAGSAHASGGSRFARHHGLPPRLPHGCLFRVGRRHLLPHDPRQRRRRDHRASPEASARGSRRARRASSARRKSCVSDIGNVCVFCGSSRGADPEYAEAARRLGAALAHRGIGLVYGGASVGLMGVVADAAIAAGGRADGGDHRITGRARDRPRLAQ